MKDFLLAIEFKDGIDGNSSSLKGKGDGKVRSKSTLISAVLLAAGESKRLGIPKLLLPLGDKTILEHSIDNLLGTRVNEVIVVLGYRAKDALPIVASRPVKVIENHLYQQGMSTSIIAGLRSVDSRASAVLFALADQPFIRSAIIDRLVGAYESSGKGIIFPLHMNKMGHPVIFSMKYKEELMELKGDVGGREIIQRHSDDVYEVTVDSDSVCTDIDTAGDYRYHLHANNDKVESKR